MALVFNSNKLIHFKPNTRLDVVCLEIENLNYQIIPLEY